MRRDAYRDRGPCKVRACVDAALRAAPTRDRLHAARALPTSPGAAVGTLLMRLAGVALAVHAHAARVISDRAHSDAFIRVFQPVVNPHPPDACMCAYVHTHNGSSGSVPALNHSLNEMPGTVALAAGFYATNRQPSHQWGHQALDSARQCRGLAREQRIHLSNLRLCTQGIYGASRVARYIEAHVCVAPGLATS
jgi:hypothetical protein